MLLKFPKGSFGARELRESWVRTEETERLIFLYSPINRVIFFKCSLTKEGGDKTLEKKKGLKMPSFLPLIIGTHVDCAHKPSFSRIKVGFL